MPEEVTCRSEYPCASGLSPSAPAPRRAVDASRFSTLHMFPPVAGLRAWPGTASGVPERFLVWFAPQPRAAENGGSEALSNTMGQSLKEFQSPQEMRGQNKNCKSLV